MRWCLSTMGSAKYILPVTLSTSVSSVSPYNRRHTLKMYLIKRVWDELWDWDRLNSEMHLEAVIERVWIGTWRLRLSELRDALGGHDWANLDMHSETKIDWTQRCPWRPGSSEFGDALGGPHRAKPQAVIERIWRYTKRQRSSELRSGPWMPWSIEFGDTLWGCDSASLEMHLQAMIEWDWRSTWSRSIWREAQRQLRLYSLVYL